MKKMIALFVLCMALSMPATMRAEDHPSCQQKKCPPDISTIVTDLTPAQKKKIDQITKETSERIHQLEGNLRQVRDSIRMYMDAYEDNTKILNPLFEREGRIETDLNKEKYRTKNAINRVLTPQQHKQLIENFKSNNPRQKGDRMMRRCPHQMEKGAPAAGKGMPAKKMEKSKADTKNGQ